jgi:hypothetical protein
MSKYRSLFILFAVLVAQGSLAAASNPGVRHSVFMAGSVIESSVDGVYLCIGTSEGAQVGQQLDVVRLTRDTGINPKQGARFKRQKVGTVRIDAIVDEHFAQATVISGQAEKGDIVRLAEAGEKMKDR